MHAFCHAFCAFTSAGTLQGFLSLQFSTAAHGVLASFSNTIC